MLKRFGTAATLALLLTACGGPPPEPPPPPPLDPTGTWDITLVAEGMEINGILVIQGSAEEGYTGSIDTEMGGTSIGNILVNDQTVTFTIAEVDAGVEIVIDGDSFMGAMSGAMGMASIFGTKRAGG